MQTAKGYHIKVNKVGWSQGNDVDKPDQGKQYCIVNVTLKNVGAAEKWDYNPFDFKLNADENDTDLDGIVTDDNINQLQAVSLDKGATVTGDLVGQANPNAGKLQLQYQASVWDNNKTLNINLKQNKRDLWTGLFYFAIILFGYCCGPFGDELA